MGELDPRADPPGDASRTVDKSRWPVLSPHLDELLDMTPGERAARLAQLRAEDEALAEDLATLLTSLEALDRTDFLKSPALPPPPAFEGQTVGAYTIERELGEGGMGSVWLARRTDGRYEGLVAIKFLHAGLVPRADAERFAREGRILARLAHPHIARLIDAGLHGSQGAAQPYLVLEYVDGLPIDLHCERYGLDLASRLQLFLDVLAAVAHAHHRLILHRDLKPTNILVTAQGDVKLLDFGIAKLLRDTHGASTTTPPPDATELTQRAGRAFTLQYAAPEQLQNGEVTTATDVYALGVLLYVLLGGAHPTAGTTSAPVDQMRATLDRQPRRLSETVLRRGGPDAGRQSRALRGDLDIVVAKALKKSPAERYSNAEALAEDLRRHLAHEPIAARRDSAAYVLSKFVRRHRAGVAAAGLVTGALAVGVGVALYEAEQARRQQEQAEGLIEFMLGDLRRKLQPVGRLEALDAVGERALSYYAQQDPGRLDAASLGRRARALHLIGEIADDRGDLDEATRVFRQAAESTAALVERHPHDGQRLFDHAQSLYWVGFVARRRGQADEAERAFRGYLDLAEQLVRLDPTRLDWRVERAYAQENLGVLQVERSQPAEALKAFNDARSIFAAAPADRTDLRFEEANALGWIAKSREVQGDLAGALAAQRDKHRVLSRLPTASNDRHVQRLMANAIYEQGRLHLMMGETGAAIESARQSLAGFEALLAIDPKNADWQVQASLVRLSLAEARWAQGQPTAAREILEKAESESTRLLTGASARATWRLALQGNALRLRLALADPWPGAAASLQSYLDAVRQAEAGGLVADAGQARLAAAIELGLGDLRAGEGAREAARTAWLAAAARLRQAAFQGDLAATVLLARVLWRLGDSTEARALTERAVASAYRHPDLADLRERLTSGEGAASHHHQ
jgi:eukaryotic-like serine/threonine-protein kinase